MLSIGSTPKETHLDFERRSRREDRNYTWAKSYKFDTKSTVYGQFRAKIEILTQMIRATPIQKKTWSKAKIFHFGVSMWVRRLVRVEEVTLYG